MEEIIEEAAKKYMQREIDATFDDDKNHELDKLCSFHELEVAFIYGARWALQNQWHDVKEELPEDGIKVIVLTKKGNAAINSVYTFNGNRRWHSNYNVSYWMSITSLEEKLK